MMKHLQEKISEEVVETLSAQERQVIVLLYVEQLRVAEVSEVLEMPPERVIAIVALVQCRVRMAITGGLRARAVPLWDQPGEHRLAIAARRRLSKRSTGRRRAIASLTKQHRRTSP